MKTIEIYSKKMSNHEGIPDRNLWIVTRVFTSSEGNLKVSDTMNIAGYETPERKEVALYQLVHRASQTMQKKLDSALSNVPPSVECNPSAIGTDNSPLSSNSISPSNGKSSLLPAYTAFN